MKRLIIAAFLLTPALALAQSGPQLGNIQTLLTSIGRLVNIALPIVVGIALLGFFWGLAQFIFAAGNDDKKEEGKKHMIWGIIGLFVMVAVWGLVAFVGNALGIQTGNSNQPQLPTAPGLNY